MKKNQVKKHYTSTEEMKNETSFSPEKREDHESFKMSKAGDELLITPVKTDERVDSIDLPFLSFKDSELSYDQQGTITDAYIL